MKTPFRTLNLLEIDGERNNLQLRCVAGRKGLDREIQNRSINRPGLALGGFFDFFSHNCIQIFGRGESKFIQTFKEKGDDHFENIRRMMQYDIPCCIFSNNNTPTDEFIREADKFNVPVLITELSTTDIISELFGILSEVFAQKMILQGVVVEVFGVGILVIGKSGVGKSETALELIERGHRLVADDTIELSATQQMMLIGRGATVINHHMEIKGIGIINVKDLFGVGAIRDKKRIQLVIELEQWNPEKEYESIGDVEKTIEFLDINIPHLLIPVMPGRNIPIIVETAAMNQRLKMMGTNSAKDFTRQLMEFYETEEIKNSYIYNKE